MHQHYIWATDSINGGKGLKKKKKFQVKKRSWCSNKQGKGLKNSHPTLFFLKQFLKIIENSKKLIQSPT
jgi:hypothetical protein